MRAVFLAWLLALAASSALAAKPSDSHYTVLMGKGPSGAMDVKVDADGTRHVTYHYTDRGRGPSTLTDARFDAKGNEVGLSITGVDYLKAKVDEHFIVDDDTFAWSSKADEGDVMLQGRAYAPLESNSEDLAILARRLLAAPHHAVDLIPSGHARIVATKTTYAPCPRPGCRGVAYPMKLYLIEGLDFEPAPIWLWPNHELAFEGSSWMSTVPKGMEADAPKIIALQAKVLAARAAAEAKAMQRRPGHPVVITHATLFDTETQKLLANSTVLVIGNKIAAVATEGGAVTVPAGAEVIDAQGKTLMPGLTDMHVHIGSDTEGRLDILNGVTTIRDMGNDMDELLARRRRFATGEQIGPRIWLACLVDGPGPFAGPTKMLIATPEQAHAAVKLCFDDGYQQMKIYSSVDPKLVPVIIADAHARGMRVSGHIPAGMIMEQGIAAGYDEVQHANFWFLNFRPQAVTDKTNTIVRLKDPAEHAKDLDLDSPEVARFVALLQAHHTAVDPTLVAFEDEYTGDPRKPGAVLAADIARLPPAVARGETGDGLGGDAAQRAAYAESFERFLQFTKKLRDAGIRLEPGTDGMAGFPLARELEDYVRAGVPASEVLYDATLGDARIMHHDQEQGSIAPGKFADLILIDGNPVADISDVRKVVFVMKDGVIYDLPAIERSVGVKPLADQQ
ncbi:MAG TPA: amidohydrolase family protein [Caulobacteraceae bacterium]|jgi:hypothetical protein